MGLGSSLIQRKDVNDLHYGSVFFFNIFIGLLLSVILFFSAPLIGLFYKNEQLVPIARVMSALFIISSMGNVLRVKLRKELDYAIPTQANLISAGMSGAVGVTMAFSGFGVWSLVAQSLLSPTIANLYLFYKVKWRPKLLFAWKSIKELWSFGFRMFISGIIDTVFTNLDSMIIGKLFSPATLGYYFRARSLNNYVVQYSSKSIMSVMFPALSKVQHDPDVFRNIVFKSYQLINFLAFLLTGLFFVTGADLIILLFGPKWQPAIPMFNLIILTAYGYPLSSILVNVLSASGNSRAFLKLEIIKKTVYGLCLALGFVWGIKGFLICNIFAYALAVYINMVYAGRQMNIGTRPFLKISGQYFFISVFIATGLYLTKNLIIFSNFINILLYGISFVILYIFFTRAFRTEGYIVFSLELKKLSFINKISVTKAYKRTFTNNE